VRALRHFRSRVAAFTHDIVMIPGAWFGAYWLRYNLGPIPDAFIGQAFVLLPLIVVVQGVVFWYFGLYRGVWRFASIPDFLRIAKAVMVGAAASAVLIFLLTRMQYVPRSVLPLYAVLLFGFLGVPRLVYRWLKDHKLYHPTGRRTLIVGSGEGAEMLVRDLLRQRSHEYKPVALVDDSPSRQGREIHGIRVVGTVADIPSVAKALEVELILIAIPSVTSKQMRRLVELCEAARVPFRTLPPITDLVSGQVTVNELRPVSIEDLLGREPVRLDWEEIRRSIQGRRVLVTGGAGSIGSELCRQIAPLAPATLAVVDKSEVDLYRIEQELGSKVPRATAFEARLADVCDRAAVEHLMRAFAPEIVFHAAAYKHVPMLETQAREAVRNNVFGTGNVAHAAIEHEVEAFVLISTDKAVNPTNVMGASKRAAEILCQGFGGAGGTRFLTVRFGNVLGSTGSVVPLFREQIERGGPVTVTHPEVERYFMTTSEACQLILQAAVLGRGGEIFVLDMGEPVHIRWLAEQMILLSGRTPGEDIEIVYTGLRRGEKMREELFHEEERLTATAHSKILQAHYRALERPRIEALLERLEAACERFDEPAIERLLVSLVPEFRRAERREREDNVVPLGPAKV